MRSFSFYLSFPRRRESRFINLDLDPRLREDDTNTNPTLVIHPYACKNLFKIRLFLTAET